MLSKKTLLSALFLSVFTSSLSFASTFVVNSTEGLVDALNQAAVNGEEDTVVLSPGEYNIPGTISISVSDGKSLTIKAQTPTDKPVLIMEKQPDDRTKFILKVKMDGDDFGSKVEFNSISFKGPSIKDKILALNVSTVNGDIFIRNCEFDKLRVPAVELFSQTGNIYVIHNRFKEIDSFNDHLDTPVPVIDCSNIYYGSDPFLVFKELKSGSITSKSISGNIYLINNDFMDHISLKSKVSDFSLIDSSNSSENGKVVVIGSKLNSLYVYKTDEVILENNELNRLIASYSKNLYVERNIFKGSTYYGYFHIGGIVNVENSNFKNNVFIAYPIYDYKGNIYNGESSTFSLCFIPDSEYKKKSSVRLINNTFVTTLKGKKSTYAYIKAKKATIYNNIFEFLSLDVSDATIKNNLFSPDVTLDLDNPFYHKENNIVADPGFQTINNNEQDYHISKNSPAIDKGRTISIDLDIDGNPRVEGKAIDIGADEYTDKKYPVSFKYFEIIPDSLHVGKDLFTVFETQSTKDSHVSCSLSLWNREKGFNISDCKGFHIIKGKALNTGEYAAYFYVKNNNDILYDDYSVVFVKDGRPPFIKIEYPKVIEFPADVNFDVDVVDDKPESLKCTLDIYTIHTHHGKWFELYEHVDSCNPGVIHLDGFPDDQSGTLDKSKLLVRFTAKDNDGYQYKKEDFIYISGTSVVKPDIKVKASKKAGFAPLKVDFDIDVYDRYSDNDICEIDFDNDGITDKTIENCQGFYTVSFIYEKEGFYSPVFTVKSQYGTSKKIIRNIEVRGGNKPPNATFHAILTEREVPLGVIFVIKANDPDGGLINCKIDFNGDGSVDKVIEGCFDEKVPHIYTEPGTYNAVLYVEDDSGSTVSYSQTITAKNFKKKKRASIRFDNKSFNAIRDKLKLPDTLKGKTIDIFVETPDNNDNDNPTIAPKDDIAPIPVVGEDYISDVREYVFPFGLLNMKIEDINPGEEVYVKVKLPEEIPENAKFVKILEDGTTVDFPEDRIKSSKDGKTWEDGLVPGNRYVKILLKDGGNFDEDGLENGVIVDPSGIAVPENTTDDTGGNSGSNNSSGGSSGSGGGCSVSKNSQITDILPYTALLLLFAFRFSRRERAF